MLNIQEYLLRYMYIYLFNRSEFVHVASRYRMELMTDKNKFHHPLDFAFFYNFSIGFLELF